ncbi:MAG: hypothetical protein CMJ42_11900 [Phyllobacteriaceae bacterium]|nr:hypothetical protein [Phyllobacteriaceae bacterium]MBA91632.1 hypothetical protein [Phyllobacteriaceae bacterium]
MPSLQAVPPDHPRNPVLPTRIISITTITGVIAVTLFFATEAIAGAIAMVWAVSGLMHLTPTPTLILYGLALAAAVAATAKVAMLAWAAETDPANNAPDENVHGETELHQSGKGQDNHD